MTISGPWYITTSAVLDYCRLVGAPEADEAALARAAVELERLCADTVERMRASGGQPKPQQRPDHYLYRGPRPLRVNLIVSHARRSEGDLPQLVAVTRGHGSS